jgi:hypothetical protein
MAAVPSVNIVIPQGTTFSELFTSTESDGAATNLAGYSGAAKIRKHPGAADSTSFSVAITGSTGEVTISMASSITQTLKPGRYYYDVYLTSSSAVVSRMVEGQALVTAGIST